MGTVTYQGDTNAQQILSTRTRLACGVVGGPLYVTVTMAQLLIRNGFDLTHHRFTLLTTGGGLPQRGARVWPGPTTPPSPSCSLLWPLSESRLVSTLVAWRL